MSTRPPLLECVPPREGPPRHSYAAGLKNPKENSQTEVGKRIPSSNAHWLASRPRSRPSLDWLRGAPRLAAEASFPLLSLSVISGLGRTSAATYPRGSRLLSSGGGRPSPASHWRAAARKGRGPTPVGGGRAAPSLSLVSRAAAAVLSGGSFSARGLGCFSPSREGSSVMGLGGGLFPASCLAGRDLPGSR